MNITIEVDARQVQEAMQRAPGRVMWGLSQWVSRTAFRAERTMKEELSDNVDTGELQSSVHPTISPLRAVVRPTAAYAIYVHDGRRPGAKMPPYGERTSLGSWARRRGIPPFVVARSIARKGIKADKYVDKTHRTVKPWAEREGNQVLSEIVRSI